MKDIRFVILAAAALFASVSSFAATTTKVTVNGMVCSFCAQGIEKRLTKLPGTKAVFVDLKQKIVAVEAKDGMQLDQSLIKTEITEAGYDVVKMESVTLTAAQVRQQVRQGAGKEAAK